MPVTRGTRGVYRCSFCGKSQDQVRRLVAGPGGVYICDECVDMCREIMEEVEPDQLVGASRHEYPGSAKAFFAGLSTANDPRQRDKLYPTVHVEFTGRSAPTQQVFLVGRDSTGIVVRDLSGDDGSVHFYPWSSIFCLTP